ncbi:MAG: hypothetical protein H6753_05670 [Candidatus Omnitrophica bacterium]|nr:hypothetical protein [Candidatus Omnitrophota bacterium]
MKRLFTIFVILTQVLLPSLCFAGGSYSQSFTLIVTIPAIVGLNVPDPTLAVSSTMQQVAFENNITSNTETQYTEIAAVRDHQNITLRTLVVR